MMQIPLV